MALNGWVDTIGLVEFLVTGDAFQKVMLDPSTHRGGLLTQAGVLSGPIHSNHENPVSCVQ